MRHIREAVASEGYDRAVAMELSPRRLREATFAEAWRGYRMDQVRELLDDAADALEELARRAGDADQRAALAEQRLVERPADDELSRTLVLAQRTADAARREAEEEAARILGEAEERSAARLREVEGRAAELEREMEARAQAELEHLNERRAALEADVALLAEYVERQRGALAGELRQLLSWLDHGDHLDAPPVGLVAGGGPSIDRLVTDGRPAAHEVGVTAAAQAADGRAEAAVLDVAGDRAEATGPGPDGGDGAMPGDVDTDSDDEAWAPRGDEWQPTSAADDDAGADGESASPDTASMESDPFLAELRRAVEDNEPLGPRDDGDDEAWAEHSLLFDQDITGSGRFRRRRR